ncbi:MAG: murein DD-endopeptidase MepM/ murein hydrolase activator NlpD [Flavobacteriales bacterium]|jgi:murein DD-endopeptidase MepM/ murein hydrolase activator NlpD
MQKLAKKLSQNVKPFNTLLTKPLLTLITILFTQLIHADITPPKIIKKTLDNGNVELYGDNDNPMPLWLSMRFTNPRNLNIKLANDSGIELKPYGRQELLATLSPKNAKKSYDISYSINYAPGGNPKLFKADENHVYLLPFAHGKKYKLGQGYFGKATHQKPNPYALDFNMETGTSIHASRAGLVIDLKEDSDKGGSSPRFNTYANYVSIMHSDGSVAEYAHLQKNGVLINIGDTVKAGQKIALSGDTGQSSGPHLHFDIYKYTPKGKQKNFPTVFRIDDSSTLNHFTEGKYYYSNHPNKKPFKRVLGRELKNSDYESFHKSLAQNNTMEFSFETIDDTLIVFVENTYPRALELNLDMELENYRASKDLPITMELPALSKQFVSLLKLSPNVDQGAYSFSSSVKPLKKIIDDKTYLQHIKKIPRSKTVKIRSVDMEDNILLYARNGNIYPVELTLTFDLENFSTSKSDTLTIKVLAQSEIYLQHLSIDNLSLPANYRYSIKWIEDENP